jgi:type VI secretion system protein ImpG
MRDDLLNYYERELAFIRSMGGEFAEKYPKIASRLLLEADKCEDPHVERLIEAFAFLAARVHLKIDDEFPEITESLLNILYPHYLAPIPSMSIAQFTFDPDQGKLTTGYHINKETSLYSRPINGTPCRFRTCYPVTVWPLEVVSATLESLDPVDTHGMWEEAVIRLHIRCLHNAKLSELTTSGEDGEARRLDRLRFYLYGEPQFTYALYEMIFNNSTRVDLRPENVKKGGPKGSAPLVVSLPPTVLEQVGLGADEGMLPYTQRSFMGYRLLTEYFTFPEKFLFLDISGLDHAAREARLGEEFSISIYLKDVTPPRGIVSAATFQLGCSPIINLFSKVAEPIQITALQNEYRVVPDVHRQGTTEVYSVNEVTSTDPYVKETRTYRPFYSIRHSTPAARDESFWYATRRPSLRNEDQGTEVYISLVDLGFNPAKPAADTLTVHTTSSNRDLPSKLPFGVRDGDFEVEGTGPLARVRCLRKPTDSIRSPLRRGAQWRLISHLSLNHLSISGDGNSADADALREILSLYNFTESPAVARQITGISEVISRHVVRQTGPRIGTGFARGIETTILFDEEMFVGSGVFLFASLLERFLGLYVSINSFNQLVAKTEQREGTLKKWKPRAGEQTLL